MNRVQETKIFIIDKMHWFEVILGGAIIIFLGDSGSDEAGTLRSYLGRGNDPFIESWLVTYKPIDASLWLFSDTKLK